MNNLTEIEERAMEATQEENVVYLAYYARQAQALIDEHEARIAALEAVERQIDRDDRAIRRYRKIISGLNEHIEELERQLAAQRNRAIMPAPVLNAEPDGDVVWA